MSKVGCGTCLLGESKRTQRTPPHPPHPLRCFLFFSLRRARDSARLGRLDALRARGRDADGSYQAGGLDGHHQVPDLQGARRKSGGLVAKDRGCDACFGPSLKLERLTSRKRPVAKGWVAVCFGAPSIPKREQPGKEGKALKLGYFNSKKQSPRGVGGNGISGQGTG